MTIWLVLVDLGCIGEGRTDGADRLEVGINRYEPAGCSASNEGPNYSLLARAGGKNGNLFPRMRP